MNIVRLADAAPQPWRNGGGTTRDLLALPTGANWDLRISVAEVGRDGPFSAYPGVERWFAVVTGAGVVLHFGDIDCRLGPQADPLHFDGAAAPDCTLIDGPTQDLNLLVQAAAGRGSMASARAGVPWTEAASLRAVFTAGAATLQCGPDETLLLPALSLAWQDSADPRPWTLHPDRGAPMRAWWLAFSPLSGDVAA